MKALTLIFILLINVGYSQCVDVFGSRIDCPTESDSLVLYQNALQVYDFYEKNPSYEKTRSAEIMNDSEKREVFDMLFQARKMFFVIRKEVAKMPSKFSAGKPKPKYVDIDFKNYYQEIDEYRFYQRELENQIINKNAPVPMYDLRICPIIVNEYKCVDSTSEYYGDLVNIPLYIPVVVKPYLLLTADEHLLRNEILHIIPKPLPKEEKRIAVKRTYKVNVDNIDQKGYPVYMAYQYGGGALIGFLVNGRFRKIKPYEYKMFAVPPYAQKCLEDNEQLDKMLKLKFGGYYKGLIND